MWLWSHDQLLRPVCLFIKADRSISRNHHQSWSPSNSLGLMHPSWSSGWQLQIYPLGNDTLVVNHCSIYMGKPAIAMADCPLNQVKLPEFNPPFLAGLLIDKYSVLLASMLVCQSVTPDTELPQLHSRPPGHEPSEICPYAWGKGSKTENLHRGRLPRWPSQLELWDMSTLATQATWLTPNWIKFNLHSPDISYAKTVSMRFKKPQVLIVHHYCPLLTTIKHDSSMTILEPWPWSPSSASDH